jgi:hypothetical protein
LESGSKEASPVARIGMVYMMIIRMMRRVRHVFPLPDVLKGNLES